MNVGYKIKIQKGATEQETQICYAYWDIIISEAKYRYSVAQIAKRHNLKSNKVTEIIKRVCLVQFSCYHCRQKIMEIKLRSNINLEDHIYEGMFVHNECRRLINATKNRIAALYTAIQTESWRKLNKHELDALTIITKHKTKSVIIREISSLNKFSKNTNDKLWTTINLLELMQLIWVERVDGHIVNFHHHPHLKRKLEEYTPENFLPEIQDFNQIEIKLKKNDYMFSYSQPQYCGNFKVPEMILLHPDASYRYGVWVDESGEVYLRLSLNDPSKD